MCTHTQASLAFFEVNIMQTNEREDNIFPPFFISNIEFKMDLFFIKFALYAEIANGLWLH